jgi:TonB family protein
MSTVVLLAATWLLAAAQQVTLQQAIDLYWNGEYERTLQLLGAELADDEVVEGHKYRAFSFVALGRNDEARAEFVTLLESDPSHVLDAALVSPKIVEQFELSRQELAARLLEQGKTAYFDGRFDEASVLLGDLLDVDPSSVLGREYLQLARERSDLERRTAALEPEEADAPEEPEVDPNRVYNIGGNVTGPVVVDQPEPRYPRWELRRGTEGEVILRLTIGRDGNVESAEVIRSLNQSMDNAALRAARAWRYEPAQLDGNPVRVFKVVAVRFRLER